MNNVWKLMKFEFKLLLSSGSIFFIFFFPLMFILIEGQLFSSQSSTLGGIKILDSLVPGIIIMSMATIGINTLANAIVSIKESKIMKRLSVTPIKAWHFVTSYVIFYSMVSYISAILIFIFAKIYLNVSLPKHLLELHLIYFSGVISMMLLGFLISIGVNNVRALTGKSMLVFQPTIFLGGAALPISFLPSSLKFISKFIPLTYISEPFKYVWNGSPIHYYGFDLMIVWIFIISMSIIVISKFEWN